MTCLFLSAFKVVIFYFKILIIKVLFCSMSLYKKTLLSNRVRTKKIQNDLLVIWILRFCFVAWVYVSSQVELRQKKFQNNFCESYELKKSWLRRNYNLKTIQLIIHHGHTVALCIWKSTLILMKMEGFYVAHSLALCYCFYLNFNV